MKTLVIEVIRKANNNDEKETGKRLCFSQSYISELESGRRPISMGLLRLYSDIYGISFNKILELDEKDDNRKDEDPLRRYRLLMLEILKYYLEEKPRQEVKAK